ncbi:hypothetical protein AURDEDRAFT_178809 [Auricularia subglabra TFB-10046 SS5]|uniref:Uncharacterized protein n=1 Tax=Auricularia subglabra (strain TFB-10046 / SS5) TaxID=717982 RepID=J0CPQ8_AURST|nr:hypothetical protein AURDEDRAFT_178809 [Auricularia subglabra TFB-10046 SS5]
MPAPPAPPCPVGPVPVACPPCVPYDDLLLCPSGRMLAFNRSVEYAVLSVPFIQTPPDILLRHTLDSVEIFRESDYARPDHLCYRHIPGITAKRLYDDYLRYLTTYANILTAQMTWAYAYTGTTVAPNHVFRNLQPEDPVQVAPRPPDFVPHQPLIAVHHDAGSEAGSPPSNAGSPTSNDAGSSLGDAGSDDDVAPITESITYRTSDDVAPITESITYRTSTDAAANHDYVQQNGLHLGLPQPDALPMLHFTSYTPSPPPIQYMHPPAYHFQYEQ